MKVSLMIAGLMIGLFIHAQSAPASSAPAPASAPASASSPISGSASAPAASTPATDLSERKTTHVDLRFDSDHRFEVDLPGSPIIHEDEVNMIPGEEFFVEMEVVKGRLVHPRRVEKNIHPEKTLQLHFYQSADKPTMLFTISNPFKQTLKYRSEIVPAGQTEFQDTSNVGVRAELTSYEMWPFPIVRILLSDFRLISSDDNSYTPGK